MKGLQWWLWLCVYLSLRVCLVTQSCPTLCGPRLYAARLLCPWNSPGKGTGVGCPALLQGSSQPRDWTWVSCGSSFAGRLFIPEPPGKPRVYVRVPSFGAVTWESLSVAFWVKWEGQGEEAWSLFWRSSGGVEGKQHLPTRVRPPPGAVRCYSEHSGAPAFKLESDTTWFTF